MQPKAIVSVLALVTAGLALSGCNTMTMSPERIQAAQELQAMQTLRAAADQCVVAGVGPHDSRYAACVRVAERRITDDNKSLTAQQEALRLQQSQAASDAAFRASCQFNPQLCVQRVDVSHSGYLNHSVHIW